MNTLRKFKARSVIAVIEHQAINDHVTGELNIPEYEGDEFIKALLREIYDLNICKLNDRDYVAVLHKEINK